MSTTDHYSGRDQQDTCPTVPSKSVICIRICVQVKHCDPASSVPETEQLFGCNLKIPNKIRTKLARVKVADHCVNWSSMDHNVDDSLSKQKHTTPILNCGSTLFMDGYLLSYFLHTLNLSTAYAESVFRTYLVKSTSTNMPVSQNQAAGQLYFVLQVKLVPCARHYFDRIGSRILNSFLHERIELDDTLSWLSSLGGAFSALGDISTNWAEQAGRITIHQLQIALRLGDPLVISRCHLYAAISLTQKGYYWSARKIIRNEYRFAKNLPAGVDQRLIKMCQGIWAKLKYTASVQPAAKSNIHHNNHHQRKVNGLQNGLNVLTIHS